MAPLAETLRPQAFDQVIGQDRTRDLLHVLVKENRSFSILLWGPPGCGKTTLARIYARHIDPDYITFSGAYSSGVEIKKLLKSFENSPLLTRKKVLFIDEIHRFNKAQQDIFLPFLEKGTITLVGATTENPSFEINDALLSRLRVLKLDPLEPHHFHALLEKTPLKITEDAKQHLFDSSHGDARHFLNLIENLLALAPKGPVDLAQLTHLVQKRLPRYDKNGDNHHDLISALHKAVRGSDPDLALYYLARMLTGGEDPDYIARRLMRMATEDIGLADPHAATHTLTAWQSFERVGSPEGDLFLAQAVIYLALAPKSRAVNDAFSKAQALAGKSHHLDANVQNGKSFWPKGLDAETIYEPKNIGFERDLIQRLNYFRETQHNCCF